MVFYKALVGNGVQPSEFWQMSPNECWVVIEGKIPPPPNQLTDDAKQRLEQRRCELEAQGKVVV